jgi:hypothetical protein
MEISAIPSVKIRVLSANGTEFQVEIAVFLGQRKESAERIKIRVKD